MGRHSDPVPASTGTVAPAGADGDLAAMLPPVNPRLPLPIYVQVTEQLHDAIETGHFTPGTPLPSERQLAEHYGISRMTVRQALAQLEDQGLLYRRQGAGSFVADPKHRIEQGMDLTSFTEDMASRGLRASSQILAFSRVPATPDIAARLNLAETRPVWLIRRLRLADDVPMAVETTHVSTQLVPVIPENVLSGSLYRFLHERYGLEPYDAEQSYEAALARVGEAELLGVRPGAPVLLTRRITRDIHLRTFEYVRSVYRADRYRLTINIARRNPTRGR